MAVHKLVLEDVFETETYTLIAIHCNVQDYRLAYLLNDELNINLKRNPKDLDYKYTSAWYAIYEWKNKAQAITWSLVSNVCKKEEEGISSSGSLFNNQNKIMRYYYLVPEYKTANYLLKIDSESTKINEKKILESLQKIPQVATAYSIDLTKLKSKDNLILN